jgi:hypothetical protein
MSEPVQLERRYRRLLAFYPRAFRREHEDEIVAVLLDGAGEDQRRPRPADVADLLTQAVSTRLKSTRFGMAWAYEHRAVMIPVRVVLGIWIAVIAAFLFTSGQRA